MPFFIVIGPTADEQGPLLFWPLPESDSSREAAEATARLWTPPGKVVAAIIEAESEEEALRAAAAAFVRDHGSRLQAPAQRKPTTAIENAAALRLLAALSDAHASLIDAWAAYLKGERTVQRRVTLGAYQDTTRWMELDRETLTLHDLQPWAHADLSVSEYVPDEFYCHWHINILWIPRMQHWLLEGSVSHSKSENRSGRGIIGFPGFPERTAATIGELAEQLHELVQEVIASRERIDARAGRAKP